VRKHRRGSGADEARVALSGSAPVAPGGSLGAARGAYQVALGADQPRVGGYRLVRVLGEGRSAVVHLGYADIRAESAAAVTNPSPTAPVVFAEEPRRTAAVKVYRPDVAAERVDAEIAALDAVDHPHVLRLIDVATTDDALPCLVLERCDGGGLVRFVAENAGLSAGEAVTILAPLVAAVGALHASGHVHRDIRLSSVLFRQSGAPVLCSFGRAAVITSPLTPAGLAADAAVLADRRALLVVVRSVLERVDDPAVVSAEDWLERHDAGSDDFGGMLTDALFDLAEPQPVRLRERPQRAFAPALLSRPRERGRPADDADVRRGVRETLVAAVRTIVGHARGVRRRYWTIAAGVAACLVVAVIAVPSGAGSGDAAREPTIGSAAGATPGPEPTARGEPVPPPATSEGSPMQDSALIGDDPVAALLALLAERERCVRDLSVLCLDGVLQQGSAALQRDTAVIRALQAGGEQTPDATVSANGPVLVERLGDSALLDLGDVPETQPASTLVMRGEAGWRIRDYLSE